MLCRTLAPALAFPALALAAELPQTTLQEVTVSATSETQTLTAPSLSQAQAELKAVPGGANVVDSESYATGRASTLQDALGYSPGVFVQPRFGAEESRLSIRGSGIQRTFHMRGIKLMQDGVPLNLADGGGDFQAIEPMTARYINVFRGANALQYGSTTLGGAIDFVSPTGYDADRLRLRAEAGSFAYTRALAATGGVDGPWDYFVSGAAYKQDGYRDWSKQENARLNTNIGYRIAPDLETRFYAAYVNTDSQLPGNLTKAQLQANPEQANASSLAGRQKRDFELTRLANRTVRKLGDAQVEFSAFYSHKDLWHPIYQVLEQRSDDYGLGVRYVSDAPLGGRRNHFVIGFSPTWNKLKDDRFTNIAGTRGTRTAEGWQESYNLDLYAENQHEVAAKWIAVVGAQATQARRKYEDLYLANGDQSVDKIFGRVSPKLGVRYEHTPDIDFFANVSGSFEPPSLSELFGGTGVTPVSAQRATTLEVGSRGKLPFASWDAAIYRARVRDELLSLNSPTGTPLGTVNAPHTLHQGVELGLTLNLGPRVEWRSAYLYNDFRFDNHETYGNNELPGIPRQFYRGELQYKPVNHAYVAATLEYSPSRYAVDMANTLFADGYTLWGLKAGWRVDKGLSWFVEGRNLANRKYAATTGVIADAHGADSAQFLPGDGRAFFAGLDWRI